jgi:hypothetical protein
MIRSAASKVMWVGRATVFLVGLSVILAVVLGVATAAVGATNGNFILGRSNQAETPTSLISTLTDAAKSALIVNNKSGGAALDLRVDPDTTDPALKDVAPMKVNSQAKVANLNSDELDGKSEEDFYAAGTKVADSDRLDNYDSRNFGISTLQSATAAHGCDTPSTWNQCAPVTFTNLDPGKVYIATVWSSFSARAPGFTSREVSYCAGMSGLSSPTPCLTGPTNNVRVHDYFTAASASAVETVTGASSYTFFTAISPSGEFEVADGSGVITTAILRNADTPSP